MNENIWSVLSLYNNSYDISSHYTLNTINNIGKSLNDEVKELRQRVSDLSTELNNVIARDQLRQKEFEKIMNLLKEKIKKNE